MRGERVRRRLHVAVDELHVRGEPRRVVERRLDRPALRALARPARLVGHWLGPPVRLGRVEQRRVALGRHRAEKLRRRVREEAPLSALGTDREEARLTQPPALARPVSFDKGEVHHDTVAPLNRLLYEESRRKKRPL